MSSWEVFERAEPEMAEKGRALLYQRGDGEGFLTTVAANGTPRIHPLNVRGEARLVTDAATRQAAATDWFFTVSVDYPLYELLIEHALLGERGTADDWPPRYRSWRSAGS